MNDDWRGMWGGNAGGGRVESAGGIRTVGMVQFRPVLIRIARAMDSRGRGW
ncbi:MAG TPA: hypothetical protein VKV19_14675 [Ktedonobacteraceae bacterium]|jgi:hypothetical protein|nr:hypothetical protein [Ktedonobacteraceae bacterium]